MHLPFGIVLSSFHYGFGAVALFSLYFRRGIGHRSWALAAVVCLTLAASGFSFFDSLFNIVHFHFAPFAVLAAVFLIYSALQRSLIFPTLAGGCALISILAFMPTHGHNKLAIFMQAWLTWFGLVYWRLYKCKHPQIYSLVGAFILLLSFLMYCLSSYHLAWGADYIIVIVGLSVAGWFLEHGLLRTLAAYGVLGGALYLTRSQLIFVASELRRLINGGWLATAMAFLILPFAYFLSVVRARRRGQAAASSQSDVR